MSKLTADSILESMRELEGKIRSVQLSGMVEICKEKMPDVGTIVIDPNALPGLPLPNVVDGVRISYSDYLPDNCGALMLKKQNFGIIRKITP